jgi:hypothetical protein
VTEWLPRLVAHTLGHVSGQHPAERTGQYGRSLEAERQAPSPGRWRRLRTSPKVAMKAADEPSPMMTRPRSKSEQARC